MQIIKRSERVRKIKRTREKARKMLNQLVEQQKNKCFFCNSDIVRVKLLTNRIVINTESFVIYESEHALYKARVATIEHIKPISEGGNNDSSNLVASCRSCNQLREYIYTKSQSSNIIKVKLKLKKWFDLETDLSEYEFKFVHFCLRNKFGSIILQKGSDYIYEIYKKRYLIKKKGIYKI